MYAATSVWAPQLEAKDDLVAYHGEIDWKDHDYRLGGFNSCSAAPLRQMVEQSVNYEPRCQQSQRGANVDLALIGDSHLEHLFIGLTESLPHRNIMYFAANASPAMSNSQYAAAVSYVIATPTIKTVLVTSFWGGRGVSEADLAGVLRALINSGKTVFITDGVPNFPFTPFGCKYRAVRHAGTTCSQDASGSGLSTGRWLKGCERSSGRYPACRC